ncbi:MFS transporter [Subtercola vilae]|uniref:MFS transporter n=1 Tax=Subtercola vilae TaxID=2056433 RepID=UPI001F24F473|nr:MFS transporter [Subtercola vilae]
MTDPVKQQARSWNLKLLVLAATAAAAVSTIYLPQSMLTDLATTLGVPAGMASLTATAVQVGYAVGIFLLVPLSDRIQPRRQITTQLILLASALLLTAVLPEIVSVALGFLVVGLVANIAQLTIPAANKLAPAGRSGSTTTVLLGALLIGIFGGRIVASLLVGPLGWRWVMVIFALGVAATIPFLRRALRSDVALGALGRTYGSLLLSTLRLARTSRALRLSSAMHFFAFATFNTVWTVMVLHLTGPLYGWSVAQAGLFGLVGLAAGVITPFGGRFVDRFGATRVGGLFLVLLVFATVTVVFDEGQGVLFGISVFVLTWANQSAQSANQNRAMTANPGGEAQANTVFMVSVFLGGSLGAMLGPVAYGLGGMSLAGVVATGLALCALAVWVVSWRVEVRAAHRLAMI